MKVAIICDVLGEANNGTVVATENLINHLRSAGHVVYVVSSDKSTEKKEDYYVVPTINFGKPINGIVKKNGVSLAKPDKELLRRVIEKADIVHLQIPFALSRCAVKIARELNKPITASFHCQAENVTAHVGMINSRVLNHLTYVNFYKHVYRFCDAIHYPTEFIRRVFYANVPVKAPYYVISNGVDEDFFVKREPKKGDKFTIMCTGRYSREKAQDVLIKAVAESKYKDGIKVVLAGAGPKRAKLKRLAKKKNVDCSLKFFKRKDLLDALSSADLYVHTAEIEIEAIAAIEAIASGLVAIIADSERSATRFFAIDDRTKFKNRDYLDLKDKIEYFYENRGKIEEYKKKYAGLHVAVSKEECMKQMEAMLSETIANKG